MLNYKFKQHKDSFIPVLFTFYTDAHHSTWHILVVQQF